MGLINDKIIIHKYGPCYNLLELYANYLSYWITTKI